MIGLPSFIVGTAFFMLGQALHDRGLTEEAALLYAVAVTAFAARLCLSRARWPAYPGVALLALAIGLLGIAVWVGFSAIRL